MIKDTNSDTSKMQFALLVGREERIATTYVEFVVLSFGRR
jgi:hypothetical protein